MSEKNKMHKKLHREREYPNGMELDLIADVGTNLAFTEGIIIQRAEAFLTSHIKHKNFVEETIHPWRKDAKQIILHSLRVNSYALKIIETEKHRLTEQDKLIIQLSAILHDVGKFYRKENHGQMSANVVEKWLSGENISQYYIDSKRLLKMIKGHSEKDAFDNDLCSMILKDADTLDEIGAMSVFMTSNWLDKSSPYFFHELSNRLQDFELAFCDKSYKRLKTEYAKEIMKKKKAFVEGFIKELNFELEGTEEFYQLLGDQL